MFLHNITYKVNKDIAAAWVQWQKEIHMPAMINTGYFYENYFYELPEQEDAEGKTFSIQFLLKTRKDYDNYIFHNAPQFRNDAMAKWGNGYVAFRTLMKEV